MPKVLLLLPLAVAVLGVALFIWAFFIEPSLLLLTRTERTLPGLERPVRVLLLSDLHLRERTMAEPLARLERVMQGLVARGERPDIVVYAGDVLEVDTEAPIIAAELARIGRTALGEDGPQLFVLGNHESEGAIESVVLFTAPFRKAMRTHHNDADAVARAFAQAGMTVVNDEALDIAGVRWVGASYRPGTGVSTRVDALLRAPSALPTVLVTHSPDQISGIPAGTVALALAGHTHGGQVQIPFYGALTTATKTRLPAPAGWMTLDDIPTFIGRGAGQSTPPRFLSAPEAVLLTLRPQR